MAANKFNKRYFEDYAIISLATHLNVELLTLLSKDRKTEKPDFQSETLNLGIEVTEAITTAQGTYRSIINEYFGNGLSGEFVKQDAERRFPKAKGRIEIHNGAATYYWDSNNTSAYINQIKNSIVEKTEKLNKNYKIFAHNWLYVFSHYSLFNDLDISGLIKEERPIHIIEYEKIFIDCIDRIFVISEFQAIEIIEVTEKDLKTIKSKAFEFSP